MAYCAPNVWTPYLQVLHLDPRHCWVFGYSSVTYEMQSLIQFATCLQVSGLVPKTPLSSHLHRATMSTLRRWWFQERILQASDTACHGLQASSLISQDIAEQQAASTPEPRGPFPRVWLFLFAVRWHHSFCFLMVIETQDTTHLSTMP